MILDSHGNCAKAQILYAYHEDSYIFGLSPGFRINGVIDSRLNNNLITINEIIIFL